MTAMFYSITVMLSGCYIISKDWKSTEGLIYEGEGIFLGWGAMWLCHCPLPLQLFCVLGQASLISEKRDSFSLSISLLD